MMHTSYTATLRCISRMVKSACAGGDAVQSGIEIA
jgi:hypothetical protein